MLPWFGSARLRFGSGPRAKFSTRLQLWSGSEPAKPFLDHPLCAVGGSKASGASLQSGVVSGRLPVVSQHPRKPRPTTMPLSPPGLALIALLALRFHSPGAQVTPSHSEHFPYKTHLHAKMGPISPPGGPQRQAGASPSCQLAVTLAAQTLRP